MKGHRRHKLPSGGRVDVVTKSDGTRLYAFRSTAVLTEPDIYALMREVMARFNEAVLATGATEYKPESGQSGHSISRDEERHANLMADLEDRPRPESPLSNKTGRSENPMVTMIVGHVPACVRCGLVGHLAEDCTRA